MLQVFLCHGPYIHCCEGEVARIGEQAVAMNFKGHVLQNARPQRPDDLYCITTKPANQSTFREVRFRSAGHIPRLLCEPKIYLFVKAHYRTS
jgi:hypothetical protein